MNRVPIFSALDAGSSISGVGPLAFFWTGPVGIRLQAELQWRLQDFCRIQQIVYAAVIADDKIISEIDPALYTPTRDIESEEALAISRRADAILAMDIQNERMVAFVDHMTVVGLWAICEQYLGKIYRATKALLESCKPDEVTSPYKWHEFKSSFLALGVDLASCENYEDANECRLVNNAIKHHPIIDDSLKNFSAFAGLAGKPLERIDLQMQRYLNGVSNFLGSLISETDKLVSPP